VRRAVVLAVVVLIGLACRAPMREVELVVWDGPRWPNPPPGHAGHDPRFAAGDRYAWLKGALAEFATRHPGVRVRLVEMNWPELALALASVTGPADLPDLAPLDEGTGRGVPHAWLVPGWLEPVDRYLDDKADFCPAALAACSFRGRLVGFPVSLDLPVLVLNRTLFAERNVALPAEGRWTWEEFAAAARRLTADRDGDGLIDAWGFGVGALRGQLELWPFLYLDGAEVLSPGLDAYTLDGPTGVRALERLVALVAEGVAHPETGTAATGALFRDFALGERRTVGILPLTVSTLQAYLPHSPLDRFEVAEYPIGEAGYPVTVARVSAYAVLAADRGAGRADASRRRRLAMELGNLLSSTSQGRLLAANFGAVPARAQVATAGNPTLARAFQMATWARALPPHPGWPEIDAVIQDELGLALRGDKGPEEALRAAGRKVREILDEAGR